MKPVGPIYTVKLFPPLSRNLLTVLQALAPTDWSKPTACAPWTVKDVAAHLLGGNLGRLWHRDASATPCVFPSQDYAALVDRINQSNAEWVQAAQRISPGILIEFLALTDQRLYEYFRSLPQEQPARIAVAWAGEEVSATWFDIAREYTEKWLHQQHIREAVDQPLLTEREWLFPVLDTFLRALPHAYRNVDAAEDTRISIQITGAASGVWTLARADHAWRLYSGHDPNAACVVQIDQGVAWRLFTKGIGREAAQRQISIVGDATLGQQVLEMVSIMA